MMLADSDWAISLGKETTNLTNWKLFSDETQLEVKMGRVGGFNGSPTAFLDFLKSFFFMVPLNMKAISPHSEPEWETAASLSFIPHLLV